MVAIQTNQTKYLSIWWALDQMEVGATLNAVTFSFLHMSCGQVEKRFGWSRLGLDEADNRDESVLNFLADDL